MPNLVVSGAPQLTDNATSLLACIKGWVASCGTAPSVRDLTREMGWRSKSMTWLYLNELEHAALLERRNTHYYPVASPDTPPSLLVPLFAPDRVWSASDRLARVTFTARPTQNGRATVSYAVLGSPAKSDSEIWFLRDHGRAPIGTTVAWRHREGIQFKRTDRTVTLHRLAQARDGDPCGQLLAVLRSHP